MKTYFYADPHFYGEDILNYENRPFSSVEEMNETLIKYWNAIVTEKDRVFILGDFADFNNATPEQVEEILKQLNGKIIFIKGNHDNEDMINICKKLHIDFYEYPIIFNNFWMLSHEPMYISEQMPYANIFGHVHNNPMYKTVSKRSYCVSVERTNYTPISFEDIVKAVQKEANNK